MEGEETRKEAVGASSPSPEPRPVSLGCESGAQSNLPQPPSTSLLSAPTLQDEASRAYSSRDLSLSQHSLKEMSDWDSTTLPQDPLSQSEMKQRERTGVKLSQCPLSGREASTPSQYEIRDLTMSQHLLSERRDLTASRHLQSERGDLTISQHQLTERGDLTASRHLQSERGDLTISQHQLTERGDLTASRHLHSERGDLTISQHQLSEHGDLTISQHQLSGRGDLTISQHQLSEHGDLTISQHQLSEHGDLTISQHQLIERGDLTASQHLQTERGDLSVSKHEQSKRGDLTVSKYVQSKRGDLSVSKHMQSKRGDLTVSKHLQSKRGDLTISQHQLSECGHLTASQHLQSGCGDLTISQHQLTERGDLTASQHLQSERGDFTISQHQLTERGNLTASRHLQSERGDLTISQHQLTERGNLTASRHLQSERRDLTISQHQLTERGNLTASRHLQSERRDLTVSQHQLIEGGDFTTSQPQLSEQEDLTVSQHLLGERDFTLSQHVLSEQEDVTLSQYPIGESSSLENTKENSLDSKAFLQRVEPVGVESEGREMNSGQGQWQQLEETTDEGASLLRSQQKVVAQSVSQDAIYMAVQSVGGDTGTEPVEDSMPSRPEGRTAPSTDQPSTAKSPSPYFDSSVREHHSLTLSQHPVSELEGPDFLSKDRRDVSSTSLPDLSHHKFRGTSSSIRDTSRVTDFMRDSAKYPPSFQSISIGDSFLQKRPISSSTPSSSAQSGFLSVQELSATFRNDTGQVSQNSSEGGHPAKNNGRDYIIYPPDLNSAPPSDGCPSSTRVSDTSEKSAASGGVSPGAEAAKEPRNGGSELPMENYMSPEERNSLVEIDQGTATIAEEERNALFSDIFRAQEEPAVEETADKIVRMSEMLSSSSRSLAGSGRQTPSDGASLVTKPLPGFAREMYGVEGPGTEGAPKEQTEQLGQAVNDIYTGHEKSGDKSESFPMLTDQLGDTRTSGSQESLHGASALKADFTDMLWVDPTQTTGSITEEHPSSSALPPSTTEYDRTIDVSLSVDGDDRPPEQDPETSVWSVSEGDDPLNRSSWVGSAGSRWSGGGFSDSSSRRAPVGGAGPLDDTPASPSPGESSSDIRCPSRGSGVGQGDVLPDDPGGRSVQGDEDDESDRQSVSSNLTDRVATLLSKPPFEEEVSDADVPPRIPTVGGTENASDNVSEPRHLDAVMAIRQASIPGSAAGEGQERDSPLTVATRILESPYSQHSDSSATSYQELPSSIPYRFPQVAAIKEASFEERASSRSSESSSDGVLQQEVKVILQKYGKMSSNEGGQERQIPITDARRLSPAGSVAESDDTTLTTRVQQLLQGSNSRLEKLYLYEDPACSMTIPLTSGSTSRSETPIPTVLADLQQPTSTGIQEPLREGIQDVVGQSREGSSQEEGKGPRMSGQSDSDDTLGVRVRQLLGDMVGSSGSSVSSGRNSRTSSVNYEVLQQDLEDIQRGLAILQQGELSLENLDGCSVGSRSRHMSNASEGTVSKVTDSEVGTPRKFSWDYGDLKGESDHDGRFVTSRTQLQDSEGDGDPKHQGDPVGVDSRSQVAENRGEALKSAKSTTDGSESKYARIARELEKETSPQRMIVDDVRRLDERWSGSATLRLSVGRSFDSLTRSALDREVEKTMSGGLDTSPQQSFSQQVSDIMERESPPRQAYRYLEEAEHSLRQAQTRRDTRLHASDPDLHVSPTLSASPSFRITPIPKRAFSAFENARTFLSSKLDHMTSDRFETSVELRSPVKRQLERHIRPTESASLGYHDANTTDLHSEELHGNDKISRGDRPGTGQESGSGHWGEASDYRPPDQPADISDLSHTIRPAVSMQDYLNGTHRNTLAERIRERERVEEEVRKKEMEERRRRTTESSEVKRRELEEVRERKIERSEVRTQEIEEEQRRRMSERLRLSSEDQELVGGLRETNDSQTRRDSSGSVDSGQSHPASGQLTARSDRSDCSDHRPSYSSGLRPYRLWLSLLDSVVECLRESNTPRPRGSHELYYVESGTDDGNGSVANSETTVESTHIGSDDAHAPSFPKQWLGSRSDPTPISTGIYSTSKVNVEGSQQAQPPVPPPTKGSHQAQPQPSVPPPTKGSQQEQPQPPVPPPTKGLDPILEKSIVEEPLNEPLKDVTGESTTVSDLHLRGLNRSHHNNSDIPNQSDASSEEHATALPQQPVAAAVPQGSEKSNYRPLDDTEGRMRQFRHQEDELRREYRTRSQELYDSQSGRDHDLSLDQSLNLKYLREQRDAIRERTPQLDGSYDRGLAKGTGSSDFGTPQRHRMSKSPFRTPLTGMSYSQYSNGSPYDLRDMSGSSADHSHFEVHSGSYLHQRSGHPSEIVTEPSASPGDRYRSSGSRHPNIVGEETRNMFTTLQLDKEDIETEDQDRHTVQSLSLNNLLPSPSPKYHFADGSVHTSGRLKSPPPQGYSVPTPPRVGRQQESYPEFEISRRRSPERLSARSTSPDHFPRQSLTSDPRSSPLDDGHISGTLSLQHQAHSTHSDASLASVDASLEENTMTQEKPSGVPHRAWSEATQAHPHRSGQTVSEDMTPSEMKRQLFARQLGQTGRGVDVNALWEKFQQRSDYSSEGESSGRGNIRQDPREWFSNLIHPARHQVDARTGRSGPVLRQTESRDRGSLQRRDTPKSRESRSGLRQYQRQNAHLYAQESSSHDEEDHDYRVSSRAPRSRPKDSSRGTVGLSKGLSESMGREFSRSTSGVTQTANSSTDTSSIHETSGGSRKSAWSGREETTLQSIPENTTLESVSTTDVTSSDSNITGSVRQALPNDPKLIKLQMKIQRQRQKHERDKIRELRRREKINKLELMLSNKGGNNEGSTMKGESTSESSSTGDTLTSDSQQELPVLRSPPKRPASSSSIKSTSTPTSHKGSSTATTTDVSLTVSEITSASTLTPVTAMSDESSGTLKEYTTETREGFTMVRSVDQDAASICECCNKRKARSSKSPPKATAQSRSKSPSKITSRSKSPSKVVAVTKSPSKGTSRSKSPAKVVARSKSPSKRVNAEPLLSMKVRSRSPSPNKKRLRSPSPKKQQILETRERPAEVVHIPREKPVREKHMDNSSYLEYEKPTHGKQKTTPQNSQQDKVGKISTGKELKERRPKNDLYPEDKKQKKSRHQGERIKKSEQTRRYEQLLQTEERKHSNKNRYNQEGYSDDRKHHKRDPYSEEKRYISREVSEEIGHRKGREVREQQAGRYLEERKQEKVPSERRLQRDNTQNKESYRREKMLREDRQDPVPERKKQKENIYHLEDQRSKFVEKTKENLTRHETSSRSRKKASASDIQTQTSMRQDRSFGEVHVEDVDFEVERLSTLPSTTDKSTQETPQHRTIGINVPTPIMVSPPSKRHIKEVTMVSEAVQTTPDLKQPRPGDRSTEEPESTETTLPQSRRHGSKHGAFSPEGSSEGPYEENVTPSQDEGSKPVPAAGEVGLAWYIPLKDPRPWRKPLKERQAHAISMNTWPPMEPRYHHTRPDLAVSWQAHELDDHRNEADLYLSRSLSRDHLDPPKSSLQDAFLSRKVDFISRSRERLRHVMLRSEERRIADVHQQQRSELFKVERHRDPSLDSHPYSENLFRPKKRSISRKEMKEITNKKYATLSEVTKKDAERRREAEYSANRIRAEIFKKKVLSKLLHRKAAWVQ